jgi:DNA-binding transcriptional ArsR family regulator
VREVLLIEDLQTLRAIADPTRVAILELLTEPRSVSQLAHALDVPRTRLYHHVDLLLSNGLIEVVEERRVAAVTERLYAPTAKTYRPSPELLVAGDLEERIESITALLFDTTKSDLRRSLLAGEATLDPGQDPRDVGLGRTIAMLTPSQAAEFIAEVAALVARFDDAHDQEGSEGARPFAFTWAIYPSSRTVR